ncbi:hypothetical protein MNV49_007546 [Pseudohyphozyma bogoriensis]|nr:hypothetical protein MNV49_007546 [Pseudohyphozyma bogoriensis]
MNWPKGAKIAVNFVLNHQEEGGERSVEDGDAHAETVLHDFGPVGHLVPIPGERDPATESQFEYGARVAIWRIMKLFKKHNIPITFYAVARAFERNPEIAKYAEEAGHEIASHCFKWMPYAGLSADEEEAYIRKAVASFQSTSPTGKVPVGWFYGRPSARSGALVAKVYKELGHELLYWADSYADDIPYWTSMPGGTKEEGLVMMPYSLDNNDWKMWLGQVGSDDAFAQHCIDAFTTIREEGIEDGKIAYITVALHSRWIGRPGRFQALKKIVDHFTSFDDVWFATREQIARNFKEQIPYLNMSRFPAALAPTEEDISLLLAAQVHIGTKQVEKKMKDYVWKRRADGINLLNIGKTWEKLTLAARIIAAVENPNDVVVISARPYGHRAVLKFAANTGAQAIAGRFTPGNFTNYITRSFKEPRLIVVTDPRVDHQAIREASYVNIPVIAICDTDSPLSYVDVAIPGNNKSKHSIGLIWWLLAREVLRLRGTIGRGADAWSVMPDMFFYRDPEEVERDLEAVAQAKLDAAVAEEPEAPAQGEWEIAGAPAAAAAALPVADAGIDWAAEQQTSDWAA